MADVLEELAEAGPDRPSVTVRTPARIHRASPGGRAVPLDSQDLLPFVVGLVGAAHRRVLAAVFIIDPRPEEDPDGTVRLVLDSLARARWRGLDVRVLVGGSARTPAIELAGRVARRYLEAAGVPCRQFVGKTGETSFHSKYLIVDDTVVVGSHNWTRRALLTDNELSLALTSPALAAALRFDFDQDWRRSDGGDGSATGPPTGDRPDEEAAALLARDGEGGDRP